jgi:tetratricopeptide (TPR) repeat protein
MAQEDNEIIEQIFALSSYTRSAPDSLLVLLNAIWSENEHRMTANEKVSFYNLRGLAYRAVGKFDASNETLWTAMQYLESMNDGDAVRQARILSNIAGGYLHAGNLQEAIDTFRQARIFADNYHDPEFLFTVYINKGITFLTMGKMDPAFYYTRLAVDVTKGDYRLKSRRALSLTNLGGLFLNFREYLQAEKSLRNAATIFEEQNDLVNLRTVYSNLSSALLALDRVDDALMYAQKSDSIAIAIGIPAIAMHQHYAHKGQAYLDANEYHSALEMFYRSLALRNKTHNAPMIADSRNQLSATYARLGDLDRALLYANDALSVAKEVGNHHFRLAVYRNLMFIYAARGDMSNFLATQKAEKALRDLFFSEQNSRAIQELRVQYETEQQNLLIAQKTEALRHKYTTIALVITIGLIMAILLTLTIFSQRRKVQNMTRIVQQYETIRKLKKETETAEKNLKINEIKKKLQPEIERLFREEKIYRRPKLSVDDVTKMLNTNQKYLSTALSEGYQKGFPEFVNTFRIDDAIEILQDLCKGGKYANYTMQAIGEEVGFSNRASFYNACKQIVGVAPLEYMEILNKQVS